jgi:FkbM family methyltransferase
MLLITAPFHCLRKTKAFRILLNSRFNRPALYQLGYYHRVAIRPLTHASILWKRAKLEPGLRTLINKICRKLNSTSKGSYFLDVGANIGLYTWQVARIAPELKIISFEPDPNNFELLKMTNEASGLKHVELCPVALSDQSKEREFNQDNLTSATGSLCLDDKPWIEQYLNGTSNKISVQTRTMDDLLGKDKIPSLVKIDVEGHEIEVLQGSRNTLSKAKPLLIIESFPPKQSTVLSLLNELGYHSIDADLHVSRNPETTNLFAWHPQGPLKETTIQKLIN